VKGLNVIVFCTSCRREGTDDRGHGTPRGWIAFQTIYTPMGMSTRDGALYSRLCPDCTAQALTGRSERDEDATT
jgi:hypothetical protein